MEKIKTYILKAIIILLFIFSFYSSYRGALSIFNNILDWELSQKFSALYSTLAVFVLYIGYKSLKFSSYQYPKIILNMEYYLGILDIIKQKKDNNEFDELEKDIVEVEWLIEDIILFYSDNKRRSYPGHLLAKELLHRVKRGNNTFMFINDKL